ncbi:MAG: Short-chain-enoyl-CoA hydratase [Alphaproteobacteria bacterium MarineAlpha11_Bin1]|nr:MAG: Short-chain-enoyl-CoA hydratase [Alphaproteobacteria bacterium MarineAlpha11_Bin1]|tara:strand:+ start:3071 stop:3880 length:810 start_codon:yes stop_codon:yes gene_type:complete
MSAAIPQPDTPLVDIELRDNIAILSLNRADKRNAVNDDMRTDIIRALDWADRSPGVAALVLTGRGKGFCAGGDISSMHDRLSAPVEQVGINGWQRQRRTHQLLTKLHSLPKPTIAAVNGVAAGLGADLALCCDFVIGATDTTFVMSYVLRGLIPDGGGMYFLPRRVGLARAKELIFSGRMIGAEEAKNINLIEQLSDPDSLIDDAVDMGKKMTVGSADARALAKSIMNGSYESTIEEVFALGSQAQGICYTTDYHREAVATFLDKREQT